MNRPRKSSTVRRSVALPRQLIEDAVEAAPAELRGNLNRLVLTSLREFTELRRARAFEEAMAKMADDPAIRKECVAISREFAAADADGLSDD